MKTAVKLTEQSVLGEIESVLDTFPYYPYQQTFAIPELRQELVNFVLSRIPCLYSGVEVERADVNFKLPRSPLEQQLYLQNLIHQGIFTLMQQKSEWISDRLSEPVCIGSEPSHWFG